MLIVSQPYIKRNPCFLSAAIKVFLLLIFSEWKWLWSFVGLKMWWSIKPLFNPKRSARGNNAIIYFSSLAHEHFREGNPDHRKAGEDSQTAQGTRPSSGVRLRRELSWNSGTALWQRAMQAGDRLGLRRVWEWLWRKKEEEKMDARQLLVAV